MCTNFDRDAPLPPETRSWLRNGSQRSPWHSLGDKTVYQCIFKLPFCLYSYIFAYVSISLFVSLFLLLFHCSLSLSLSLSIYLSIYLCIGRSKYLSIYLSIYSTILISFLSVPLLQHHRSIKHTSASTLQGHSSSSLILWTSDMNIHCCDKIHII